MIEEIKTIIGINLRPSIYTPGKKVKPPSPRPDFYSGFGIKLSHEKRDTKSLQNGKLCNINTVTSMIKQNLARKCSF